MTFRCAQPGPGPSPGNVRLPVQIQVGGGVRSTGAGAIPGNDAVDPGHRRPSQTRAGAEPRQRLSEAADGLVRGKPRTTRAGTNPATRRSAPAGWGRSRPRNEGWVRNPATPRAVALTVPGPVLGANEGQGRPRQRSYTSWARRPLSGRTRNEARGGTPATLVTAPTNSTCFICAQRGREPSTGKAVAMTWSAVSASFAQRGPRPGPATPAPLSGPTRMLARAQRGPRPDPGNAPQHCRMS
jgi:hypothetical protein